MVVMKMFILSFNCPRHKDVEIRLATMTNTGVTFNNATCTCFVNQVRK